MLFLCQDDVSPVVYRYQIEIALFHRRREMMSLGRRRRVRLLLDLGHWPGRILVGDGGPVSVVVGLVGHHLDTAVRELNLELSCAGGGGSNLIAF